MQLYLRVPFVDELREVREREPLQVQQGAQLLAVRGGGNLHERAFDIGVAGGGPALEHGGVDPPVLLPCELRRRIARVVQALCPLENPASELRFLLGGNHFDRDVRVGNGWTGGHGAIALARRRDDGLGLRRFGRAGDRGLQRSGAIFAADRRRGRRIGAAGLVIRIDRGRSFVGDERHDRFVGGAELHLSRIAGRALLLGVPAVVDRDGKGQRWDRLHIARQKGVRAEDEEQRDVPCEREHSGASDG